MRKVFSALDTVINWVTDQFLLISGCLVAIMAFLSTYGVVRRYVFHSPEPYSYQIAMWCLLSCIVLSFPAMQKYRRNLRVDFIVSKFSTRGQYIFEYIVVPIVALAYVTIVVWKSGVFFWSSYQHHEVSQSVLREQLWPIKLLVSICYGWLGLVLVSQLVHGIINAITGVQPESYLIDLDAAEENAEEYAFATPDETEKDASINSTLISKDN